MRQGHTINRPAKAGPSALPVLQGARVNVRVDALLAQTVVEQTYVNTRQTPLEVVYTFPLPSQAVFLGLETQLGHERRGGAIVARPDGERLYEHALAKGDTPVMVELADDGLLTANLGNLAPGERLTVTLRWGQWLQEEQGRIRLVVPTVVAPRFGNAPLQPQQMPEHSLEAEYPLRLTLDVEGELARAPVSCETHRVVTRVLADGVQLALDSAAALDRDVVFTLQPAPGAGRALYGQDRHLGGEEHVALAALRLPAAPERAGVALKILVDCSGSMNGDSIASARRALAQVVQRLRSTDRVTYSRFGSTVAHDLDTLTPCDDAARRQLQHLVGATAASLGGTKMLQALEAVFGLTGCDDGADVLLITDAQVWDADAMVAAARRSVHRVFAIGVGSAPREGLLRQLASATGGACEFATPGESLEQAVDRSFSRIRQQPWGGLQCVWDVQPQEMPALPQAAFGGDTLLVQARFGERPPREARLLARDASGHAVEAARVAVQPACAPMTLARMLAAERLKEIEDTKAATQLAVAYQLLTRHTCCVVVHERELADKVNGVADLHVVPQMLAAGQGGAGSVLAGVSVGVAATTMPVIGAALGFLGGGLVQFSRARALSASQRKTLKTLFDQDIPAADLAPPVLDTALLRAAVQCALDALAAGAQPQRVLDAVAALRLPTEVDAALNELRALGLTSFDAWLVLALWAMRRLSGSVLQWSGQPLQELLSEPARSRLQEALAVLDRELQALLPAAPAATELPERLQRLASRRRV